MAYHHCRLGRQTHTCSRKQKCLFRRIGISRLKTGARGIRRPAAASRSAENDTAIDSSSKRAAVANDTARELPPEKRSPDQTSAGARCCNFGRHQRVDIIVTSRQFCVRRLPQPRQAPATHPVQAAPSPALSPNMGTVSPNVEVRSILQCVTIPPPAARLRNSALDCASASRARSDAPPSSDTWARGSSGVTGC